MPSHSPDVDTDLLAGKIFASPHGLEFFTYALGQPWGPAFLEDILGRLVRCNGYWQNFQPRLTMDELAARAQSKPYCNKQFRNPDRGALLGTRDMGHDGPCNSDWAIAELTGQVRGHGLI